VFAVAKTLLSANIILAPIQLSIAVMTKTGIVFYQTNIFVPVAAK